MVYFTLFIISLAVLLRVRSKLASISLVTILRRREAKGLYLIALYFTISILVLTISISLVPYFRAIKHYIGVFSSRLSSKRGPNSLFIRSYSVK